MHLPCPRILVGIGSRRGIGFRVRVGVRVGLFEKINHIFSLKVEGCLSILLIEIDSIGAHLSGRRQTQP